jgi:arylsulfatase A-like enzyme
MNADFGFHQGFDHFDCFSSLGSSSDRNAAQTVDAVFQWVDEYRNDDPLFLAIHFYDPHITYSPPDSFADMWRDPGYTGVFNEEWGQRETVVNVNLGEIVLSAEDLYNLEALYDGELAYTDSEISRLLAGLGQRGITEDALVIVVSDHGEEFLDHNKMGHAHSLYQELLNVPLIISGPGFNTGEVCSLNVSQADIMPTVLSWAGEPVPDGLFGKDLLSSEFPENRAVPSGMSMDNSYVVTARRDNLKVHLFDGGNVMFMFDLGSDPGEHDYLSSVDSSLAETAMFYLATPPLFHPAPVIVESVFLDALKNLGYI